MMHQMSATVCKAFLDQCPAKTRLSLLRLLPKAEQHALEALPPVHKNPALGLAGVEQRLKEIHPTWFIPFLRALSKHDLSLFLAALPNGHAQEVKKLMLYSNSVTPLSSQGKSFIQGQLWDWLTEHQPDLLPVECLPASLLNPLLSLNSAQLSLLINFLGLHDLSLTVRQIIETVKLKQIDSALTEDEQTYLKKLLQKKDPIAFQKIDLSKWEGDSETLHTLLQKRGLNRLAKACVDQDPSFVWHVVHKLDTTTASHFEKLSTPLEHAQASRVLAEQVTALISMIQTPQ
jgi:hypothetical protein